MEKPKISSYSVFSQFGWCQGARLSALPPGIEISKKYIFLAFFIARHYEGLLRWASIEVHAAQWEMGWPLCFCQIWVSPTILFSSRMWARMKYSAIFHQIAHLNKEFGRRRGISLLWGWWWPGSGRWDPGEKPRFRLSRRRLSKKGGNIFSTILISRGCFCKWYSAQESLAVFQKFVSGSIITWQESSGSRKKFSHLGVPGFHLLLCTYRGNEEKSRSPFSLFAL